MACDCRRFRAPIVFFIILILAGQTALRANESYSYELDTSGTPVFTQVISWDAVEYAQKYRLEIVDGSGVVVVDDTAATTERTVHLGSGEYRYRISVFNLLGKSEYSGPWIIMRVLKAELPVIETIEPGTVYIGQDNFVLTIVGERLLRESRVSVMDATTGLLVCTATVLEVTGGEELVVSLPPDALAVGEYHIEIENPGGLRTGTVSAFHARQKKDFPREFSVSAGWAPEIPLFDEWYKDVFGGRVYPAGFLVNGSCAFTKYYPVAFGACVDVSWNSGTFSKGDIAVRSDARRVGASCFVSYSPMRSLVIFGGLGAGLAWTWVSLDDGINDADEIASIDPALSAYAEARYTIWKNAYAGAGLEYSQIVYQDASAGVLHPRIFAGWRL